MHRSFLCASLLVPLVADSVVGQKTCFEANQTHQATFYATALSPFCLKESTGTNAYLVTAIDFYLKATTAVTTTTVVLYDEDTATGKPRNLLQSGNVTLLPNVEGWYGAPLTPPVVLLPNTNFFVGVNLGNGIQPMLVTNGANVRSTPHWWNPTAGWTGPFASFGWMYRVYCFTHNGAYTSYGMGKTGTGGVPLLMGQGYPNTGNLMSLNLSSAANSAPAFLVFGRRTDVPGAIGSIYSFPILFLGVGQTTTTGFLMTSIPIPLDPALSGGRMAFQSWIVDQGATFGLSHSNGVEAVIGH